MQSGIFGKTNLLQAMCQFYFARSKELSDKFNIELCGILNSPEKPQKIPPEIEDLLINSPEFYNFCKEFFPDHNFKNIPYDQNLYNQLKYLSIQLKELALMIKSQFIFNRIRETIVDYWTGRTLYDAAQTKAINIINRNIKNQNQSNQLEIIKCIISILQRRLLDPNVDSTGFIKFLRTNSSPFVRANELTKKDQNQNEKKRLMTINLSQNPKKVYLYGSLLGIPDSDLYDICKTPKTTDFPYFQKSIKKKPADLPNNNELLFHTNNSHDITNSYKFDSKADSSFTNIGQNGMDSYQINSVYKLRLFHSFSAPEKDLDEAEEALSKMDNEIEIVNNALYYYSSLSTPFVSFVKQFTLDMIYPDTKKSLKKKLSRNYSNSNIFQKVIKPRIVELLLKLEINRERGLMKQFFEQISTTNDMIIYPTTHISDAYNLIYESLESEQSSKIDEIVCSLIDQVLFKGQVHQKLSLNDVINLRLFIQFYNAFILKYFPSESLKPPDSLIYFAAQWNLILTNIINRYTSNFDDDNFLSHRIDSFIPIPRVLSPISNSSFENYYYDILVTLLNGIEVNDDPEEDENNSFYLLSWQKNETYSLSPQRRQQPYIKIVIDREIDE